jgi:dienelactone hydrolase
MEYVATRGRFAGETFAYRLFQPMDASPQRKYPLLVWTSGYGEMGDNNFAQLRHLHYIFHDQASGEQADFYCLVMQVPERHANWIEPLDPPDDVAEVLMALIDDIQKRLPIDAGRIYLSGVSAGGSVCWELLQRHPERFAAVAPLASGGGGIDRERLASVVDVPVWVFHAARDPLSPIAPVKNTVATLEDVGGIVHLTEIDSDYHDCWTAAFQQHRLMVWLFAQQRGRTCWLRPGWTPVYLREIAVMAGIPLLLAVAIISERRRRRRARATLESVSAPIARVLVALVMFNSLSGCDPPPPGRSKPYSPALYVRGDFHSAPDAKRGDAAADAGWEVCDDRNRMRYVEKERYEALIPLPAGKHQFKIADRTWHAVNLGGWPNAANMELDTPYGLLLSEGSWNLVIEVAKEATYCFTLHSNNRQKPLLIVSEVLSK